MTIGGRRSALREGLAQSEAASNMRHQPRQESPVPDIDVRSAGEGEQQRVIDVITLAFSSDPMARWSLPDPGTYLAQMPEMVRAFGGRSLAAGTADVADGGRAAALWLPPDVQPDVERLQAILDRYGPDDRRADMKSVFEQMDQYHPKEPCWFLPVIGVDPCCQGRGYGSALLRHGLERCDRDRLPVYLESSNERNLPLYERHGFIRMGHIQAGRSPTVIPMLRQAR